MKYRFFLSLLLLLSFGSQAQTPQADDPRSQFVGLNNGQRVYAKRVQIKSPLLKSNYFLLDDSIRFATEAVKYYQNEDGFFLKIEDPYGRDDFAERLISGRISKYYISKTYYNNMYGPGYGYGGYGYGGFGPGWGGPSRRNIYFISKDDGPLQNYSFNNLMEAMSDNPGSIAMLERYRTSKRVENAVSLVGAGLLIYGFTQSFNQSSNLGPGGLSPAVYAGGVLISIPWISGLFKKDRLTQAIELYNYGAPRQ
ncbi:MAG: hypothetical protein ACO1NZ_00235 [Adhaeribacter sp.]